jgi:hypothetical protein
LGDIKKTTHPRLTAAEEQTASPLGNSILSIQELQELELTRLLGAVYSTVLHQGTLEYCEILSDTEKVDVWSAHSSVSIGTKVLAESSRDLGLISGGDS